jgi:two-component system LytT family response regulator
MKLKVAIIDDEKHAIDTLIYDLQENHAKEVEIVFSTTDPFVGIRQMRKTKPDILFLDINMPGISGLDMLELIDNISTRVIFETAHMEYAVKAVETIASGYILKPVQADDLQRVIEKVKAEKMAGIAKHTVHGKIPVPDCDGIELVSPDEIIYCKSDSNYCELNLIGNRKILASKTLRYFGEILPEDIFIRIHKSYLVNLKHVKKYMKREGGELLMVNNDCIPVSRNHRDEILKLIRSNP